MAEGSVTVAYVVGNTVHYSWMRSMWELREYDAATGKRIEHPIMGVQHGSGGLVEARNMAVSTFLRERKSEWLFWIDTDMGFAADTVDRLLEAADPEERPLVGALCFFNRQDAPDGMGGYRHTVVPTIYDFVEVDGQRGWQVRWDYKTNTLTRVGGTGAACVLIHRSVFERIEAAHGRVWYDRVPNTTTGTLIGEDLSFCLRAGALKIPMYVHTGVSTTHAKQVWLGEADYWRDVALNSAREAFASSPEVAAVAP